MPGDDPRFLVVPSGVAGELENLRSQVLHDGGQVDGGTSSNPLGVIPLAEEPTDNESYREDGDDSEGAYL